MTQKKKLEILLKLLKAHACSNRNRSNDLLRDKFHRQKDLGAADAYEYVVFMLERPELIEALEKRIDEVVEIICRP